MADPQSGFFVDGAFVRAESIRDSVGVSLIPASTAESKQKTIGMKI
jgi:hypothetical protein